MLDQHLSRSREGATGGRPRRSGRRRTLRASVLHPTLPGRLRAPTRRAQRPASEQLRFGRSYVGDGPGSASWDSWGDPDSLKCRGRAPAGARPASLGARRPGVIACPGTPRVRPLSAPAPTGALPPRLRGDKKEAPPVRFPVADRPTGPAKRWLFDRVKKRKCAPGAAASRRRSRRPGLGVSVRGTRTLLCDLGAAGSRVCSAPLRFPPGLTRGAPPLAAVA